MQRFVQRSFLSLFIVLSVLLCPHLLFGAFSQESAVPATGNNATNYVFSAAFSFPYHSYGFQIHIYCNGSDIAGSPFTANVVNAQIFNFNTPYEYTTGTLNYTTKLAAGAYTYRFAATYLPTNTLTLDSITSGPAVIWGGAISGYVCNYNGAAMTGLTVTLSGSENESTATDGTGYYQFLCVNNGALTVSPAGSFSPANISFNNLSSMQPNENFKRTNTAPALTWTGESNYQSSGVYPHNGSRNADEFIFRIKYTDADNDAPSYVLLHILSNGSDIVGSPFPMSYTAGSYSGGAIYAVSTTLAYSSNYTYYFAAADCFSAAAQNTPVKSGPQINPTISGIVTNPLGQAVSGVNVTLTGDATMTTNTDSYGNYSFQNVLPNNNYTITPTCPYTMNPQTRTYANITTDQAGQNFSGSVPDGACQISWTGEQNYSGCGVYPVGGSTSTIVTYRIKYSDTLNMPPATGYPKLHIIKGGVEISSSPMVMIPANASATDFLDGVIYYSTTTLLTATDYTYYFEAKDYWNSNATVPAPQNGPQISNPPVLSFTGETGYQSTCISSAVAVSGSTFNYRILYSQTEGVPPQLNYPKLHIYQNGVEFSGSPYNMSYATGNYVSGAIYQYSTVISTQPGINISYSIEANNFYGSPAVQITGNGPTVYTLPVLSWLQGMSGAINAVIPVDSTPTFKVAYNNIYTTIGSTAPVITIFNNAGTVYSGPMQWDGITISTSGETFVTSIPCLPRGRYTYCINFQFPWPAPLCQPALPNGFYVDNPFPSETQLLPVPGTINAQPNLTITYPDNPVFEAIVIDSYSFTPAPGYPKLYLSLNGYTTSYTLTNAPGSNNYSVILPVSLSTGVWQYWYGLENINNTSEFATPYASIIVNSQPASYIIPAQPLAGPANTPPYFINVSPAIPTFAIVYVDTAGYTPATGYPKLYLQLSGTTTSYVMPQISNNNYAYTLTVPLSSGTWSYWYTFKNPYQSCEYSSSISSFVVTVPPPAAMPVNIANNSFVPTINNRLSWTGSTSKTITYQLYFGNDPSILRLVYEGKDTSFTLPPLEAGRTYYWQVNSIDSYGDVTQSAVFSLTTIAKPAHAFNYPNPFQAGREKTNIVFVLTTAGNVRVDIYSMFGELLFERTLFNLPAGINSFSYDGKDSGGNILFSGTYTCIITKENNKDGSDKCRLLIIR
ncbi:MAG: carboxypeptidase regulatory-like domain-containing protein [Endomicrobiales bacterium]